MSFINKNNLHKVSIKDKFDGLRTGDVIQVAIGTWYIVTFDKNYIKMTSGFFNNTDSKIGIGIRDDGWLNFDNLDLQKLTNHNKEFNIIKVYRAKNPPSNLKRIELSETYIQNLITKRGYELIFSREN